MINELQKHKLKAMKSRVLIQPYITEKGISLEEKNQYVFRVEKKANKIQVKNIIEDMYKVKVEKVMIAKKPAKTKFFRGRAGKKPGFKKAIVKLKAGEKIEL